MLTFLVAAILLLMVLLSLLARIPLFREFGSAFSMSVLTLIMINYEGLDGAYWAPWVLGIWFSLAFVKLLCG